MAPWGASRSSCCVVTMCPLSAHRWAICGLVVTCFIEQAELLHCSWRQSVRRRSSSQVVGAGGQRVASVARRRDGSDLSLFRVGVQKEEAPLETQRGFFMSACFCV